MTKVYYESLSEAIERNKPEIASIKKRLEDAGVKYVLSSWIQVRLTNFFAHQLTRLTKLALNYNVPRIAR